MCLAGLSHIYPENDLPTEIKTQTIWKAYTFDRITPLNFRWKRYYQSNNGEHLHSEKRRYINYNATLTLKQPTESDYNDEDGYPYNPEEIAKEKYQEFEYWTSPNDILECLITFQKLSNETKFVGVRLCGFKTKLYESDKCHKIWLDATHSYSQLQSELLWHSSNTIDGEPTNNVIHTEKYHPVPQETLEKIIKHYHQTTEIKFPGSIFHFLPQQIEGINSPPHKDI